MPIMAKIYKDSMNRDIPSGSSNNMPGAAYNKTNSPVEDID